MYALSSASAEDLADLQEDLGLGATLLSDPAGEAIRAFGMTDPKGIPDPHQARSGTFLIDRDGKVRKLWLPSNYRKRPAPDLILEHLRGAAGS